MLPDRLRDQDLVLESVGISEAQERVYRLLLERPGISAAEDARLLEIGRPSAAGALSELERKGVVSRSPGKPIRYNAAPPDVAVGILILQRQEALDRARLEVDRMAEAFRAARPRAASAEEVVELALGRDAIAQRFAQLQQATTEEMLVFDRPPYASTVGTSHPLELRMLERGVNCRTVYERRSLELEGR